MTVYLGSIEQKPSDFKVCKKCGNINWYENEGCIRCNCSSKFDDSNEAVLKWYDDEVKYWEEVEGYSLDEIDNLLIDV